ncbi:hypothetical protein R3P38DRAFT_2759143 [Favolaschia claudopus]|uniref:Uncharacterized protein n=1 Tax=Favolaschia claudopus TaxID=2862362 RepID=A0AAW0E7B2_9AGAR
MANVGASQSIGTDMESDSSSDQIQNLRPRKQIRLKFINCLERSSTHSVPEDEHGGDILECAEVILTWLNDSATSFDAAEIEQGSEKDFWSSEIDTDNDSTESENEFEDSEPEVEQYKDRMISMGECEEGSTYNELLFKNLVDMSEISESCHCLSVAESKPTHLYIDERNRVVEPNRRL